MEQQLRTRSGLPFRCRIVGSGDASPVVALHGFSGSGCEFLHIAGCLPNQHWILPDLFGHGGSPMPGVPPERILDQQLELLDAVVQFAGRPVHFVAYSMGARIALHFLARHMADRVRAAFLIGVSPGLEDESERHSRLGADRRWAALLRREGVAAFRRKWRQQPVLASHLDPASPLGRQIEATRMEQDPWNLAACIDGMSPGRIPSLWHAISTIRTPVTLIAGASDDKFLSIHSRMQALLPVSSSYIMPSSGHSVHLDNPGALVAALNRL